MQQAVRRVSPEERLARARSREKRSSCFFSQEKEASFSPDVSSSIFFRVRERAPASFPSFFPVVSSSTFSLSLTRFLSDLLLSPSSLTRRAGESLAARADRRQRDVSGERSHRREFYSFIRPGRTAHHAVCCCVPAVRGHDAGVRVDG